MAEEEKGEEYEEDVVEKEKGKESAVKEEEKEVIVYTT